MVISSSDEAAYAVTTKKPGAMVTSMGTTAYINIVIHEGDNIVGYAVVEIYTNDLENEPAQTYSAKLRPIYSSIISSVER